MIGRCIIQLRNTQYLFGCCVSRKFSLNHLLCTKLGTPGNLLELKKEGVVDILPLNSDQYLENLLTDTPKQTIYCGFDPTARSLQLGNLVALIALLKCQRLGHNVIALIGSATGFIGDPSGRDTDRPDMLEETLSHNVTGMTENISRILANHEENYRKEFRESGNLGSWEIVENMQWYRDETVIKFLSEAGSYLKLRDLISRDSVKLRMKSSEGMNIREFLYPLFQAYDWAQLFKTRNCRFQIGGSDQIGNITSGFYFIEKMLGEKTFGLTVPLFTIGGKKVGKSSGAADTIWLNQSESGGSAYNLYQKLLKTPDFLLADMLNKFTLLSADHRSELMSQHEMNPESRVAQKVLANEITKLVHGESALNLVEQATDIFFRHDSAPLSLWECSSLVEHPGHCPVIIVDSDTTVEQMMEEITRLSALRDNKPPSQDSSHMKKMKYLVISGRVSLNDESLRDLGSSVNAPDDAVSILKLGKYDFWFVVNRPSQLKLKNSR